MKKSLLIVLGMCVILGMSGCGKNVDSDQTSESIPAAESTENVKETTATEKEEIVKPTEEVKIENQADYIAAYGQKSVEGKYITVAEVEGLTFVPHKNKDGRISISIYNNGEACGWISTEKFDEADWMEDAETKLTIRLSSHTGGAEVIEETETEYGKRYLVVDETNQPYTYGETEWLINAGVFHNMEEALAGHDSRYSAVYGAAGSEYAYILSVDKHFMNDELFDNLLEKIVFKADAFTKEAQESFCEAVASESYREDDLFTRLFKSDNSGNMKVHFKVEDFTYSIPDNMLAIQTGKGVWNLFKFSMTSGGKEIGTVEYLTVDVKAEELEKTLQAFVPDAKLTDTEELKKGQVFTFTETGAENMEHVFVVPNKGEAVLYLQYKIF